MEHVVFFPAPDGAPAFRRVPSLEEAVRLVEHLRNVEGVSSVSVHALSEVPLTFRAYYKVEVPGAADAARVPAQAVAGPEPVPAAVEPAPEEEPLHEAPAPALVEDALLDEPVLATSNGRAPAGPTSLGFFA